jgi:hypothetical protein
MSHLPHPFVPDQEVRRNFDALDRRFPVDTQHLADGAVTVEKLDIAPNADLIGNSNTITVINSYTLLDTATPGVAGDYMAIGFANIYDADWDTGEDAFASIATTGTSLSTARAERVRFGYSQSIIVPVQAMGHFRVSDTQTITFSAYKEGAAGQALGSHGIMFWRVG